MANKKKDSKKTTDSEDVGKNASEIDNLKKQIEELKLESEKNLNGWKRAQADYQNYLKNAGRDRERFEKITTISILTRFFPLHRNLSLALEHTPEEYKENEWVRGIEQIFKQSEALLNEFGVEQIKTEGEKFDPEFHEAISKEKHDSKQTGDIIREVSPGYMLNGETIVPSQVVVAE